MTTLDAALDQAGYRDDGLPISFGPWANAWSPIWESIPPSLVRRSLYFVVDALPRDAHGVAGPDPTDAAARLET